MSLPIVIDREGEIKWQNDFRQYRFEKSQLPNLLRRARQHRASPAEFLPLVEMLNRQPIEAFESLKTLHAKCHGGNSVPSSTCIRLMRDFLLESVDHRLQKIYRKHLRDRPARPGASHEHKIAGLEFTRSEVASLLSSHDWCWFVDWLDLTRIGETTETSLRQLANFAFPIQMINFRFTYHCNISCRHCFNNSGPHRKAQRIPLETMLAIVAEMPELGIGHLHLSGGEPFLYQDDIVALVAAARVAGVRFITMYTNGFWASTDERAAQILERLAQAGFMRKSGDQMRVSTGVYHQEFIAFDRILTLARNYYARFGRPALIDIELSPQACDATDIRDRINAAGLADKVKLEFRRIASVGRGKRIEGAPIDTTGSSPCHTIDQIAFDPDGSVRPCCGSNNEHHGVIIGRAGQHRLKTLAKRMQNDPIMQFLSTRPMREIFDYAPITMKKEGYGGPCHLCMVALAGVVDREPLQAALFDQQKFYPFWFTSL